MALTLKQRLKDHHMDLLQQLDREYEQRVVDLMRQKEAISRQIMEQYYQLMLKIEKFEKQETEPSLHSAIITPLRSDSTITVPAMSPLATASVENDEAKSQNSTANNDVVRLVKTEQPSQIYQPCMENATRVTTRATLFDSERSPNTTHTPTREQNGNNGTQQKSNKRKRVRAYKCQYCEYESSCRSHIVRHERIHTGEKPFRCIHCEYRSARKDNLDAHLKTHLKSKGKSKSEMPMQLDSDAHSLSPTKFSKLLKCSYCEYRAVCQSSLTRHEKGHVTEQKATPK